MKRHALLMDRLAGTSHVIWDWNGTLLDDVDHAVSVVNLLLKDHGLPSLDVAEYRRVFCFPVVDYYKKLGFDFSKQSFTELCDRFVEAFVRDFHRCPLIPAMERVVQDLHVSGTPQSILSASDQQSLDRMVDHFGLRPYLRHVTGIDNRLAGSKVARGHELLKKIGTSKGVTLVGDTLHDLEVGKELGIDVVLVAHGHQSLDRLRSFHDDVILG